MNTTPVKIVETVLRDGHQSLAATRMRITDMLPVLEELDDMGIMPWRPGAALLLTPACAFWMKIRGNACVL